MSKEIKSADEFRKEWMKNNPNTIHIPSEHELFLMEEFAKYYKQQFHIPVTDEEIKAKAYQHGEETSAGDKYFADCNFYAGAKWMRERMASDSANWRYSKKTESMKTAIEKANELKSEGHEISSIGENEIWYLDKHDKKLRCIYRIQ